MVMLFKASSIMDNLDGHDHVTVYWFCRLRRRPIAPYEVLIEDWHKVDAVTRRRVVTMINFCFRPDELADLKKRLKAEGIEVREHKVHLPVRGKKCNSECWIPGDQTGADHSIIDLPEDDTHKLSVPISGFYFLGNCPETTEMPGEHLEYGLKFAKHVLRKPTTLHPNNIPAIVEAIYAETGLHVVCGKTKEEREKLKLKWIAERHKLLSNTIYSDPLTI